MRVRADPCVAVLALEVNAWASLQHLRDVPDLEAEVVHHASLRVSRRGPLGERDQHAWEPHGGQPTLLDDHAAEVVDPQLLVDLDVCDVQVHGNC